MPVVRRESELAPPVCEYLTAQGYMVRSEVGGCDITAVKHTPNGDELIVVELKRSLSTDLLVQAVERQRVADSVYVGVPADGTFAKRGRYDSRRRGIENLLRRLELGLILVHLPPGDDAPPVRSVVEVVLHPVADHKPKRRGKVRRALLREIAERRSGDYNVGGSVGKPLLTAYREQCILIACCMERSGPLSPSALRKMGCGPKTGAILLRNVYGWFEKQARGLYALRPGVREFIGETYGGAAAHYERFLDEPTQEGALTTENHVAE